MQLNWVKIFPRRFQTGSKIDVEGTWDWGLESLFATGVASQSLILRKWRNRWERRLKKQKYSTMLDLVSDLHEIYGYLEERSATKKEPDKLLKFLHEYGRLNLVIGLENEAGVVQLEFRQSEFPCLLAIAVTDETMATIDISTWREPWMKGANSNFSWLMDRSIESGLWYWMEQR